MILELLEDQGFSLKLFCSIGKNHLVGSSGEGPVINCRGGGGATKWEGGGVQVKSILRKGRGGGGIGKRFPPFKKKWGGGGFRKKLCTI